MSEEMRSLEEELRRMKPRPLSPQARIRIAEKLQSQSHTYLFFPHTAWGWGTVAIGAAAALLIVTFAAWNAWQPDEESPAAPVLAEAERPAPPVELVEERVPRKITVAGIVRDPVSIESVLVSEHHGTPVLTSNNVPLQPVRRYYIDRARWYDPQDGTRYSVEVPRQDVVLVGLDVN